MKKIFTFIATALVALGVNAQTTEKALFSNDGAYGNGAEISTAACKAVLGNDRTTKNYDIKLSSCKAYCADLFGQTVMVKNEDTGEMEEKTRVVYVVGNQNPKDGDLDGDTSTGSGYKPANANLPKSGTYYMITPKFDGHLVAFIVLNSGKNFYVCKGSTGENLPLSAITVKADGEEPTEVTLNEDFTSSEKVTGTVEFDVTGGETYYVFCTGSKLSFGGYAYTYEGEAPALNEVTLWEGTAIVNGWADQPGFLNDGGQELKDVGVTAGDIIRFYMTAPDNNWEVELMDGHWGGMYVRWAEYDHGGTESDGTTPRAYTIVDLTNKGYADYVLTEADIVKATTQQNWGNVFLLNGDGNLTVTRLSLLTEREIPAGPGGEDGEHVSLIDQFVSNWNGEETNTHNADGTVTYNGKQWGGLSAWLCDADGNPSDWSAYTKLVFEFAEPTPAACQGFVQCVGESEDVNYTWWGNAGIEKLECPFEGKDVTKVKQACLQAADNATYQISAIYLVMSADGIEEKVMVPASIINNGAVYNLAGQKVDASYKGIVIQNGRKFIQK